MLLWSRGVTLFTDGKALEATDLVCVARQGLAACEPAASGMLGV